MGVKLEHGKRYRARNGEVVEIFIRTDAPLGTAYPFIGCNHTSYDINGFRFSSREEDPYDLIEEVTEAPAELCAGEAPEGIKSDGSTASYYELPAGATQLQDLISYRDMNAQIGEVFRSAYRYGQASHSDKLRDARKMKFYIDAEIARLEKLG